MLKQIKKIFIVGFILFFVISVTAFVSAVDEDVTDSTVNSNDISNTSSSNTTNTSYDSDTANSLDDSYVDMLNSEVDEEDMSFSNYTGTPDPTSTTVSSLNSASDSELGLTEILNILLIVIGILLILLAIAILIKVKK